jgi:hypothetical protein
MFYNAYRLEVLGQTCCSGEFDAARLTISRCAGSLPDGSCTFDEFLRKTLQVSRNIPAWTGSTTVGTNTNPNVESTAQELSTMQSENRIQLVFDASKLLPGVTTWPSSNNNR